MVRIISNNNNNEAKEDDDNVSKDEGEERLCMKKGPWTPTEDTMLVEYVQKHGEGNWNSVQKNSGLLRCGKSCRLRWANHLRPNLKKGAFSEEEEKIIIDLHAKLGNKWAQMAAQLPGRTDNEIKNFWNTRMKKRQRAGLPLYPPEVQEVAITYYLQQQHYFEQPFSSSPSFSLLLSSCYPKKLNEPTHFSTINPPQNQPNSSCYNTDPSGNANLALPLSPISPNGSSSSSALFNQSFATHNSDPYQCSGSYIHSLNTNSTIPVVLGSNTEISSSQSPTPASSYASGVDDLVGASSMANDYYEVAPLSPQGNSGLLDAVVMEARGLWRNDKPKSDDSNSTFARSSHKRKNMAVEEYVDNEELTTVLPEPSMKKNTGDTTIGTQRVTDSEKELVAEGPLEMNSMDDDLFSLLNNFPSETPTLEWYRKGESQSLGLETQVDASLGPTDQESAWSLGSYWNNVWLAYASQQYL